MLDNTSHHKVETGTEKNFGFVFAAVFLIFSLYPLWFGKSIDFIKLNKIIPYEIRLNYDLVFKFLFRFNMIYKGFMRLFTNEFSNFKLLKEDTNIYLFTRKINFK
jgi:hypothetical protein